jgi:hypothetical protein
MANRHILGSPARTFDAPNEASKKPIYMSLRRIAAARARPPARLSSDRRFASGLMRCHGSGLRDARLCAAPPAASGLLQRMRNRNAALALRRRDVSVTAVRQG